MAQKQKSRQGEGDSGEEKVWVNVKLANGTRHRLQVKKGTGVKDFLAKMKHVYVRGLQYKLNDVLLQTNKETGELEENSVLEENSTLTVEQTFTGGLAD